MTSIDKKKLWSHWTALKAVILFFKRKLYVVKLSLRKNIVQEHVLT